MRRLPVFAIGLSLLVVMSAPAALGVSGKPPTHLDQTLNTALTTRIASTLGPTTQTNTTNTLPPGPGVVPLFEVIPVHNPGQVRAVYYDYSAQSASGVVVQPQISIIEYVSASKAIGAIRALEKSTTKNTAVFTRVAHLGNLGYTETFASTPCTTPSQQSSTGITIGPCSSPSIPGQQRLGFVQGKYSVDITEGVSPTPTAPPTALFMPLATAIANVLAGR
jgi:hypothetical protein